MNKTEDPLVEDKTYRRLQCFRIHVYYSLINAYIYIYIYQYETTVTNML